MDSPTQDPVAQDRGADAPQAPELAYTGRPRATAAADGVDFVGARLPRRVGSIAHLLMTAAWGGMEKSAHLLIQKQREMFPDREIAVMFARAQGEHLERFRDLGVTLINADVKRSWQLWRGFQLSRALDAYDIVQHYCEFTPFLEAIRYARHARHLYCMRGSIGSQFTALNKRLRIGYNALLIRRMHGLAGNSGFGAVRLDQRLGLPRGTATPILNGFETPTVDGAAERERLREEFAFPDDAFVMLVSGRLSPQKRPYLAMRIAAETARRLPDRRFVVLFYGDGGERDQLESLADSPDQPTNLFIEFAGWRNDVWQALAASDAFIFTGFLDGFANTVAEAVAMGLPAVVWADGGGAIEHVTNADEGVLTGQLSEAADYLGRLARGEGPLPPRARRGPAPAAARYSTERMALDYERMYERMMRTSVTRPASVADRRAIADLRATPPRTAS